MVDDSENSLRKAEIYSQVCWPKSFTESVKAAQIQVPVYFSFFLKLCQNKDIVR